MKGFCKEVKSSASSIIVFIYFVPSYLSRESKNFIYPNCVCQVKNRDSAYFFIKKGIFENSSG
jgi:hypothetical protein